jgi:hypothetical protein
MTTLSTAAILLLSARTGGETPQATQAPEESSATIVVTPEHQQAVERGLAWLASHQAADGSWIAKIGYKLNNDYNHTSEDRGHLGVTALACMAFLAGGHLPGRGTYGPNVERGLDFVLSCVQEDGYITRSGSRMYDHAFATLETDAGVSKPGDLHPRMVPQAAKQKERGAPAQLAPLVPREGEGTGSEPRWNSFGV